MPMKIGTYPLRKRIKLKETSQLLNHQLCLFLQLNNPSNQEYESLRTNLPSLTLKSVKTSLLNVLIRKTPRFADMIDPFKGPIYIGVSNSEPASIKNSIVLLSNSPQSLLIGGIYEGRLFNDKEIKELSTKSKISYINEIAMITKLLPEMLIKNLSYHSKLLCRLIEVNKI